MDCACVSATSKALSKTRKKVENFMMDGEGWGCAASARVGFELAPRASGGRLGVPTRVCVLTGFVEARLENLEL